MRSSAQKSAHVAAAVVLLAMVAAACGSDSKGSSGSPAATTAATAAGSTATTTAASTATTTAASTATTTAASTATTTAGGDLLGTPNKATGSPVKIGYVTEGLATSVDLTGEKEFAEATFKYANDYLGGIGGHEIDPIVCETKQDPAIAADCAQKMIDGGAAAVVIATSGVLGAVVKPLFDAKIPVFGWQTTDGMTDPTNPAFIMSNGLTAFIGPAAVAQDQGIKKEATLVIDVPGARTPAESLGVGLMKAAGVETADVVAVPGGTADFGPQVQSEMAKGVEQFHLIGDPTFCTAALRAIVAAGFKGTVTAIAQCIDPSTIKAIGKDLEGVVVSYPGTQDPTDKDFQLGEAIMKKYGVDSQYSMSTSNDQGGFSAVINFMQLMKGFTGDVTPEALIAKGKSSPEVPQILGMGATMKCDGSKMKFIPTECANGFIAGTLGADGQPTSFKALDPSALLSKMGG